MEIFNHVGALLSLAIALIGFVGWLIRLESVASQTRQDVSELKQSFNAHRDNSDIHFNIRVSEQVDRRNEHRFKTIEDQLHEINRKLDHMAGRD